MKEQGKFIVFEGIDGSGKTTQAKVLAEALEEKGYEVFLTREPGGGSEEIRRLIFNPEINKNPKIALCLFLADRGIHLERIISDLKKGRIVICDRFEGSTFAYQSLVGGLDLKKVKEFNNFITEGFCSDLTILVDLEVGSAISRQEESTKKLTHYDSWDRGKQEELRKAYLKLAETEKNWVVVNGRGTIKQVHQRILKILEQKQLLP